MHILLKYKLYHVPFWLAYNLFWAYLFSRGEFDTVSLLITANYLFFQPIGAYVNIYYLMPRFLRKGHFFAYSGLFALDILLTSVLLSVGYYWVLTPEGQTFFLENRYYLQACFASTFTTLVLVMMLKLFKEWIQSQRKNRELEKEKLETELQFLRSQLNPHFLFNTINSLFVLIRKDQEKATEVLARFSDMLRYQLYECNEPAIPLANEIHFLQGYMELEELRKSGLQVCQRIELPSEGHQIAPFILLNFLENAFKHVAENQIGEKFIDLSIGLEGDRLQFELRNSAEADASATKAKAGGIGLTNVKRRLELLYPCKHQLELRQGEGEFKVQLELELEKRKPV